MQTSFRTPIARILVLILCLVAVSVYLALVSSQYVAYRFAQKTDLESLHIAERLDPLNAEYQSRLGQLLILMQLPEARDAFRNAANLNPQNSSYWLELGAADRAFGHPQSQQQELRRAIAVDPHSYRVAWEAGNSFLIAGDIHSAFQEFRTALQGDPSLSSQIIPLCWRATPDVDILLRQAIPPSAYSSFLEFLMSEKETSSAAKVWTQIVKLAQPTGLTDVFDYVRYLIGQHQPAQAREVWQQAGPLCGLQNYQPSQQNLVINGDFSLNVLDGGFDWSYQKRSDVSLEIDPTQPHLGSRSLLISYDSTGLDDSGIQQLIPVRPNTAYHFSAYFKTQHLQGAGGPEFVLQDFYAQKPDFESAYLKDSDDWKPISGDFQTGPETSLLLLQIKRVPSGSAIRGKLWIDGVSLIPSNSPSLQ